MNKKQKNKYTKVELISQIKGFKNNPQSKLLDYLKIIKSLILKFTFLALIIKVFKQFKIIRRLWIVINTIVMSIFGISMVDLYGLSIFSALFAEITQITGNIVNYLSNTKFYNYIIGWLGYKKETPSSESVIMNPFASFFGLNKNKPTILEELVNSEEDNIFPEGSDAVKVHDSSSNPYFKEPPVVGPSNLTKYSIFGRIRKLRILFYRQIKNFFMLFVFIYSFIKNRWNILWEILKIKNYKIKWKIISNIWTY